MKRQLVILLGRLIAFATRLRGGHGSALPGLIIEKLDPGFLAAILRDLPRGVAVISGTNGKTTTTKIVVELLRAQGLRVFTNPSGSNFTRGVVSALLPELKRGKLNADIAVLELDEAYAVQFAHQIRPNFALILNVLRDQLDRFGEIDQTAKLLGQLARAAKTGVTLNARDPLVAGLAAELKTTVGWFSYADNLRAKFPNDAELYNQIQDQFSDGAYAKSPKPTHGQSAVELMDLDHHRATYQVRGQNYVANLRLPGAHNALNGAAALAFARQILAPAETATAKTKTKSKSVKTRPNQAVDDQLNEPLIQPLSQVKPACGRGETIRVRGDELDLILVKNPSGFRSALNSQLNPNAKTMIAINDHYADGRDMSWLWDVDFRALKNVQMVSGIRAYDMSLRLNYDQIKVVQTEPDLARAVADFLTTPGPKQIFATYTAMLAIRKILLKEAK
jgi:UDP-N-acetylmuramyl tripeptide synthase